MAYAGEATDSCLARSQALGNALSKQKREHAKAERAAAKAAEVKKNSLSQLKRAKTRLAKTKTAIKKNQRKVQACVYCSMAPEMRYQI